MALDSPKRQRKQDESAPVARGIRRTTKTEEAKEDELLEDEKRKGLAVYGTKDVDLKVRSARSPGSTFSKGIGYVEGLQYGGGDVLYARSIAYTALDKYFREYKRDSLVRSCIDANADWVTMAGFTTALAWTIPTQHAPTDDPTVLYAEVKDYVDEVNRTVNFDRILHTSLRFQKISGIATFAILRDMAGVPYRLLELEPWSMLPRIKIDTGDIDYWLYTGTHFQFEEVLDQDSSAQQEEAIGAPPKGVEGASNQLDPDDIFYLTDSEVMEEKVGLSSIEPIITLLDCRRYLLQEALPESLKSSWAPTGIFTVNTGRKSPAEATSMISSILGATALAPGKFMGVNQDVQFQSVSLAPNMGDLQTILESINLEIIGNFQIPRMLLGRSAAGKGLTIGSTEAEVAMRAFINGPIASQQKQLARQIEERWYMRLITDYLVRHGVLLPGQPSPIKLKHLFNPIVLSDVHVGDPEVLVPPPAAPAPGTPTVPPTDVSNFPTVNPDLLAPNKNPTAPAPPPALNEPSEDQPGQ